MDFSNYSRPHFLHGVCAGFVTAGGGGLNRNCFWLNIRAERAWHGVQGPKGPWWGPRAMPQRGPGGRPEAPGFLGFLRPQNASPHIIFFHFWDKFCCKTSWPCRSDFDIKEWFSSAQGYLGDVPPELLGSFVFLKLEPCNLVNTFRRKFRTGD